MTQEPTAQEEVDPEDSSVPHGAHSEGATLRQLVIVAVLVGALLLLHKFGDPHAAGRFDPTAMLALGFVILASFTIGHLVDVIKLPHITGYLFAGMLFGPSIVGFVPVLLWAPFDRGVLNDSVIDQLSSLETLAIALIAITAGGELKIESLRRGLRAISGILVLQLLMVLGTSVAFFYLVGGTFPAIALPGIGDVPSGAIVPIGLTLGAIAFATSPAATIAVINETGARGPMSRTVLSTVVLKDVFVVVLFGVFSAIAIQSLGGDTADNLAGVLAGEIGFSILAGILLGGVMALYLRFVGRELMLFIAGVVYLGSFLSQQLHLDAVLIFLVAGFVVSNFSRRGDALIHTVERLSMPVYVVFFTLAGAKLHLDEVWHLMAFALALVGTRLLGVFVGVKLGGWIGNADTATRRFGWMGFISQAGVAITLATFVKERFGDQGIALSNLLIAGVAINEIIGPVMLKAGLSLGGEIGDAKAPDTNPEEVEEAPVELLTWPAPVLEVDWGKWPAGTGVGRHLRELEHDLKDVVRELESGPMAVFADDLETYFKDLRREFLRQHRRLVVAARSANRLEGEEKQEAREEIARRLHGDQAELADRWRTIVLSRSARLGNKPPWTPEAIVTALDDHVDALPAVVDVPWGELNFAAHDDDTVVRGLRRAWLRTRRSARKLVGSELPPRPVLLRNLARYHLNFETPPRLEGVAALFVQAEQHVAGRTRVVFDAIVHAYDGLAEIANDEDVDLEAELARLRSDAEEGLRLATDEVGRIARDGTVRTARILSRGLRAVKDEAPIYGTLDLPERKRRSSKGFGARVDALELLTQTLSRLRKSSGGELALLAMELELVGLEAQVKDVLADHATRLEKEMDRRAVQQASRLEDALREALEGSSAALAEAETAEQMSVAVVQITEGPQKVASEAARIVREMREELLDEQKLAPLIDALTNASAALTARYEVSAGRMQRGEYKLPSASLRVEVPFREVVLGHVETRVAPQLVAAARGIADKLQPLAAAMKETERLVAFNVELASTELELVIDETVPKDIRALLDETIAGQLERSLSLVSSYHEQAETWPAELGAAIRDAVVGGVAELRGQLVDGKITRAKVEELRREANRRRLAQRANQLPDLLRQARTEVARAFTALVGETRLENWRRMLGLPVPKTDLDLEGTLFTVPDSGVELPLVYRRLFAAETMEAGDVLTGRDKAISLARATLERKGQKGDLRSVALVGLDGVGKKSVVAAVVRGGHWRKVARVRLDRPQTLDDVEAMLRDTHDAQLVVVEGLHWMVSSRPGGFAALRRFVDAVVEDAGRRAWLLSAEQLCWDYNASIAPLQAAFSEVVQLHPLAPEELKAAVMERHRLSGYGHVFDRLQGGSRIEGLVARGASRIRRPYEQYFHELHVATGGLLRDALRLWLASIRSIEGDEIVRLGRVPKSGFTALSRLSDDKLLLLFQIARQGWMDADTLGCTFCISSAEARAQLAHLAHLGLLEQHACGAHRIAVHLRGTTARVMRQKGWMT